MQLAIIYSFCLRYIFLRSICSGWLMEPKYDSSTWDWAFMGCKCALKIWIYCWMTFWLAWRKCHGLEKWILRSPSWCNCANRIQKTLRGWKQESHVLNWALLSPAGPVLMEAMITFGGSTARKCILALDIWCSHACWNPISNIPCHAWFLEALYAFYFLTNNSIQSFLQPRSRKFRYSSDSKCRDCTQPRDVEEIDSELVCGVVERVAEGRLAVSTAADCASRFINDGSSKACMCFCFSGFSNLNDSLLDYVTVACWLKCGHAAGKCKATCLFSRTGFLSMVETSTDHLQDGSSNQDWCWKEF